MYYHIELRYLLKLDQSITSNAEANLFIERYKVERINEMMRNEKIIIDEDFSNLLSNLQNTTVIPTFEIVLDFEIIINRTRYRGNSL